jgi:hypothetical protein
LKNEIKLGIAVMLVIVLLAFWPRNYAGRFVPRQGTNLALDNKTGQSCRMSGEKTPSDAEDFFKKYRSKNNDEIKSPPTDGEDILKEYRVKPQLPSGFVPDAPKPILLCSEIVDAETHREEVITRFVGAGLLVLFGIYVTVRHWRKRDGKQ